MISGPAEPDPTGTGRYLYSRVFALYTRFNNSTGAKSISRAAGAATVDWSLPTTECDGRLNTRNKTTNTQRPRLIIAWLALPVVCDCRTLLETINGWIRCVIIGQSIYSLPSLRCRVCDSLRLRISCYLYDAVCRLTTTRWLRRWLSTRLYIHVWRRVVIM
jgi:hypothetical protein